MIGTRDTLVWKEWTKKRGISTEAFAKAAVMRCGCFQGDQLIAEAGTRSLKGLKKTLFTLPAEWCLR